MDLIQIQKLGRLSAPFFFFGSVTYDICITDHLAQVLWGKRKGSKKVEYNASLPQQQGRQEAVHVEAFLLTRPLSFDWSSLRGPLPERAVDDYILKAA